MADFFIAVLDYQTVVLGPGIFPGKMLRWASEILHQLVVNIPLFVGFQPSQLGDAGFRWPIHSMMWSH